MMKASGFLFLFIFGVATLLFLGYSGKGTTALNPGAAFTDRRCDMTLATKNRKLKDHGHTRGSSKHNSDKINLEDYHPIDPVPSSKNSIRPGPIQHGTPLMPYIPQPSPPPNLLKHGLTP